MNVRALAAAGLTDMWRSGPVVAIGAGLLALGLLFNSEIVAAVSVWDSSTAYNHCFLVIPIVVYLLWDRREILRDAVASPLPVAAVAGIPLAFAWLVAERLGIMEGRQLVAMTFVELLFFAVLGLRLWWQLAGPLLYLYFLVPFGAFITPQLQDFTTAFVRHGLPILGIPAYIDGYVIEIPEGTFLIAEACAGLRFLIAAIAFGFLYSLIMYRSTRSGRCSSSRRSSSRSSPTVFALWASSRSAISSAVQRRRKPIMFCMVGSSSPSSS